MSAAAFFESFDQYALWIVQAEQDVVAGLFVFDFDQRCSPESEVVTESQPYESARYGGVGIRGKWFVQSVGDESGDRAVVDEHFDQRDAQHIDRQPLVGDGEVGDEDVRAFAHRAFARDWVEVREHDVVAAGVFGDDVVNGHSIRF